MALLALLLAGIAIWNFIVGMWIMGAIASVIILWIIVELLLDI